MEPKDFLKPFTDGIHGYYEESSFVQADLGVPISEWEYNKVFKEVTSIPNFLREEKAPILKSLYDDMKVICELFQPLYKIGLKGLIIDLTGGAVRDFVLNRHNEIKDIDVMVSLDYSIVGHRYDPIQITREKLIDLGFTEEEIQAVQWEDASEDYLKHKKPEFSGDFKEIFLEMPEALFNTHLNKIVCLALNRLEGEKQNFLHGEKDMLLEVVPTNDPNYEKSIRERLTGIVKLNSPALKFPADILITNKSKYEFLENFDINLCKASFCFINYEYNSKFPSDYSHLISRFSSCIDFFADVHNKKMTFIVDDRADVSIDATLKRFDRLKQKYPEYDVNIALFYPINLNVEKLHYAKSSYLKNYIEKDMDMSDKTVRQKMKI